MSGLHLNGIFIIKDVDNKISKATIRYSISLNLMYLIK